MFEVVSNIIVIDHGALGCGTHFGARALAHALEPVDLFGIAQIRIFENDPDIRLDVLMGMALILSLTVDPMIDGLLRLSRPTRQHAHGSDHFCALHPNHGAGRIRLLRASLAR
jgi:hypothetical protein